MKETDLAWAAGIIDGEGCVSLYPVTTRTGKSWVLRVCVSNTNPLICERLKEVFGDGNVYGRQPKNKRHKHVFHYEACSKKAERVLNAVLPYLVAKREQAKVGLASRKLIGVHGRNTKNPNVEELKWLKRQLHDLNERGVPELTHG